MALIKKFSTDHIWFVCGLIVIIATSFYIYYVISNVEFRVCIPIDVTKSERYQKTIAALDTVVDVSIKLSTALVGFWRSYIDWIEIRHSPLRVR